MIQVVGALPQHLHRKLVKLLLSLPLLVTPYVKRKKLQ